MGAEAIIGASLLGGGMSLFGSSQQANAQQSAADTAAAANNAAAQLQYQEWLTSQTNMQPWLTAGSGAVNTLAAGTQPGGRFSNIPAFSFDPTQIANDPDYRFVRDQAIAAANAQNAATGNYGSGTAAASLANLGAGLASEYENQYYNQALGTYGQNLNSQYTMPYNFLAGLSGLGQNQSQAIGTMGMNTASNIGNYGVSGANALAAGTVGAGNAYAGGLNNLANNIMSGYGTYLNNQNQQALINALIAQNGYGA